MYMQITNLTLISYMKCYLKPEYKFMVERNMWGKKRGPYELSNNAHIHVVQLSCTDGTQSSRIFL